MKFEFYPICLRWINQGTTVTRFWLNTRNLNPVPTLKLPKGAPFHVKSKIKKNGTLPKSKFKASLTAEMTVFEASLPFPISTYSISRKIPSQKNSWIFTPCCIHNHPGAIFKDRKHKTSTSSTHWAAATPCTFQKGPPNYLQSWPDNVESRRTAVIKNTIKENENKVDSNADNDDEMLCNDHGQESLVQDAD